MVTSENPSKELPAEDFTRTWRYKLGLGLIIFGHAILVAGILLPMLGLASGELAGALVVGGEVISLTSIVFLGKAGFLAIKSKVFAFIKAGYAGPVSPTRHYIGIVLLCTNVLTTYLMVLYAYDAFAATTVEDPIPRIWGLDFTEQRSLFFNLFLVGEVSFLIAIYVLGADWWERVRKVFVWQQSES